MLTLRNHKSCPSRLEITLVTFRYHQNHFYLRLHLGNRKFKTADKAGLRKKKINQIRLPILFLPTVTAPRPSNSQPV